MTTNSSWVRFGFASCAVLFPLAGCPCDVGEIINEVAPAIAVDACTKPTETPTSECALPFGDAPLAVTVEKFFTISNPSILELKLEDADGDPGVQFEEGGDVGFEFIGETPTSIGPGLSAQVGVRIRPNLESAIAKDIIIFSDANNTPPNEDGLSEIRVPITLTGVDLGVPDIEVTPDGCGETAPLSVDFGRVATGGGRVCNLIIKNLGARDLIFDEVSFIPADEDVPEVTIIEPANSDIAPGIYLANDAPDPDQPLGPTGAANAPLTLRVAFSPDVLGRWSGVLRLRTSDPDESVIDIPLVGVGVVAPTCDARVKSVNGTDVIGVPTVEPLDDVVLIADTAGGTPDTAIATHLWTLETRGPGSGAVLTNPTGAETSFSFANQRGVDVAGPYKACVVVVDDLGTQNVAPCCVDFEAVPQDSMLVQLTWVSSDGTDDMDLHFTKRDSQGRYCVEGLGAGGNDVDAPFEECDSLDCYYGSCRTFVEWDGVTGQTPGDPSLDIDDTEGFGPENTNVDQAVAGSYAFGADYFSGSVPVSMFIRLFLFGQLAGEWVLEVEDDFFEAGIVHFTDEDPFNPCVEDLTDGDANDECPAFAD